METSSESTGEQLSLWTLSVEDIPASHLAKQDDDKAQTTLDTSGHGLGTPLAQLDPDTRSWRTSESTSVLGSVKSLENWPPSGMTVDGTVYQLPQSAPRTFAIEYSLSLGNKGPNTQGLWPTATTQDHATRYAQGGMPLGMAVRLDGSIGRLNPTWVEWLMGFPPGWTDLEG